MLGSCFIQAHFTFSQVNKISLKHIIFSEKVVKLPSMGDSITQGGVKNFEKSNFYFSIT
jgi:hypothetical protein